MILLLSIRVPAAGDSDWDAKDSPEAEALIA
jgi:hypothetical protein